MSSEPAPATPEAPRRHGAWPLWLVLAISAAPVVAAWLAYFVWPPESRVNYGELIPALPLPDPLLQTMEGRAFRLSQLRGKWILLQIDAGGCDLACRTKLLYMRQLRLTQGREMERIERVWLVTDDGTIDPEILREYDGTHVVRGARSAFLAEFPAQARQADHIYVVDPLGNLMLRFPRTPDSGGMKKDLSRLLRVSRVG